MANDPKVVPTTSNWQNQAVNNKGYREGVDYSLAIRNAGSDEEVRQLQAERQNKIDAVYNGKDPYKNVNTSASYGSTWNPQTTNAAGSAAYRGVQETVNSGGKASAEQIAASNVVDPNALAALNARTAPIVGISSVYDKELMSSADVARIEQLSQLAKQAAASGARDPRYHAEAEAIRAKYGYSGGAMGDEYIPLEPEVPEIPQIQNAFDPSGMQSYLDQWLAAAQQQQTQKIDYATQQAIAELLRTKQDSDATFQEQRNQVAIDEAKAKDNQALYAEARGDRGGIGAAQYDQIMATAAQNRLAVNQAQTKLATDTARQIADLRAQGEFQKADALLSLSQQYLSQLMSLQQWGAEYGLSVAQFYQNIKQWEAEFKMAEAGITGMYNGAPTLQYQQYQTETLAEQGWMFLNAGIPPTESQLAAMGISASQAQDYITTVKLSNASKGSDGSGGKTEQEYVNINSTMRGLGIKDVEEAYAYLISKGYTDTEADRISGSYGDYLASNPIVDTAQGYKDLLAELSEIEDRGVNVNQNAVAAIKRASITGKITDDMVEKLLAQYGLG
jgi:hypothetical protein